MITVTATAVEDFQEVLELINHVFGKESGSPRMEAIFSDLLSLGNREHMRIIKLQGKPVSVVNYLINEVVIKGCTIKVANMGAVCTHENHRRKGYSKMILMDCLLKMKEEGVDFLYVSGDIDLYTMNDIHSTGKMYGVTLLQDVISNTTNSKMFNCEVIEAKEEDFLSLSGIYDIESVRFVRSKEQFFDLASRVPFAFVFNREYKIFMVKDNETIQGYFIATLLMEEEGLSLEIIEYAGNRKLILEGMLIIGKQLKAKTLSTHVLGFDESMLQELKEYTIKIEPCHYPGTMKIICIHEFLDKLKTLFLQNKTYEYLEFSEKNGHYTIKLQDQVLVIEGNKALHHVLLGSDLEQLDGMYFKGDIGLLKDLLQQLPIPVPYPYSLNFI